MSDEGIAIDVVEIRMVDVDGVQHWATCREQDAGMLQSKEFYVHDQHGKQYWIESRTDKKLGAYVAQGKRKEGQVLISASNEPGVLLPEFWFYGSKSEEQLYARRKPRTVEIEGETVPVPTGIRWRAKRDCWEAECCGQYVGKTRGKNGLPKAARILHREHMRRFGRSPLDLADIPMKDCFLPASEDLYSGFVHRIRTSKKNGSQIIVFRSGSRYARQVIQQSRVDDPKFVEILFRAKMAELQESPIMFRVSESKDPKYPPYVNFFEPVAGHVVKAAADVAKKQAEDSSSDESGQNERVLAELKELKEKVRDLEKRQGIIEIEEAFVERVEERLGWDHPRIIQIGRG